MTALPPLRNITPAHSALRHGGDHTAHAVTVFGGRVVVAELVHERSSRSDHRRIAAAPNGGDGWVTLLSDRLDAEYRGPPSPVVKSALRFTLDSTGDPERLVAQFSSPLGSSVLWGDERGLESHTEPDPHLEGWLQCAQVVPWGGGFVGLREQTAGAGGTLLHSSGPGAPWEPMSGPGDDDPHNQSIGTLVDFNGALYAGTVNGADGFQLWRCEVDTNNEPRWQRVLSRGAHRFGHNQRVLAAAVLGEALVLVVGTPPMARAPRAKYDSYGGFELLRVDGNDGWELLAGTPRFTPAGLRVPLSGLGPAMGQSRRAEFRGLMVHRGRLMLGTQDTEGFRLWTTVDGETWTGPPLSEFAGLYQVDECRGLSLGAHLILALRVTNVDGSRETQLWSTSLGAETDCDDAVEASAPVET